MIGSAVRGIPIGGFLLFSFPSDCCFGFLFFLFCEIDKRTKLTNYHFTKSIYMVIMEDSNKSPVVSEEKKNATPEKVTTTEKTPKKGR